MLIPEYDEHKSSNGKDDMFQMIALSDNNIKDRLLKFENVVEILSCMSPHVPTQIKVKVSELSSEQNIVFDLITSTRIRKPSLFWNTEFLLMRLETTSPNGKKHSPCGQR